MRSQLQNHQQFWATDQFSCASTCDPTIHIPPNLKEICKTSKQKNSRLNKHSALYVRKWIINFVKNSIAFCQNKAIPNHLIYQSSLQSFVESLCFLITYQVFCYWPQVFLAVQQQETALSEDKTNASHRYGLNYSLLSFKIYWHMSPDFMPEHRL